MQGSQEIASSHETDTAKVRKKFDGRLVSMQAIAMLLQSAGSNPDAMLIPPEEPDAQGHPTRVFSAIRQLTRRGYRSRSCSSRSEHQQPSGPIQWQQPQQRAAAAIWP